MDYGRWCLVLNPQLSEILFLYLNQFGRWAHAQRWKNMLVNVITKKWTFVLISTLNLFFSWRWGPCIEGDLKWNLVGHASSNLMPSDASFWVGCGLIMGALMWWVKSQILLFSQKLQNIVGLLVFTTLKLRCSYNLSSY